MEHVRIFVEESRNDLEKAINQWLTANRVEITHALQSAISQSGYVFNEYMITIFYRELY